MTLISPQTWASGEVRLDITLRGFFGKLRARILLGFCKTSPLIMGNRKVLLPGSFPSTRFSCGQVVFWAFWSRWGIPDSANFQTFFQLVKVGMFVKNTQMWWSVRILFGVWESSFKSFAKFCGGFICHFFFPHKKTSPPLLCQESEELEEELDEARIFDTRGHHTFSKKTMFWDAVFFLSNWKLRKFWGWGNHLFLI